MVGDIVVVIGWKDVVSGEMFSVLFVLLLFDVI